MGRTNLATCLEDLWSDIRVGVRTLRRAPAFTFSAIATVAIGIAACTAVFSLANWLIFSPIPEVESPHELVVVRMERAPGEGTGVSDANVRDLKRLTPALLALSGWQGGGTALQAKLLGASPFIVQGTVVQGDYFGTLGVRPTVGRFFNEDELSPKGPSAVVVVSHRFWATRLGASGATVGATLLLNSKPFTVVGVTPPGFVGTERTSTLDVWLPAAAFGTLQRRAVDMSTRGRTAAVFFELVGRLDGNASAEIAESQLRDAMRSLVAEHPDSNSAYALNVPTVYEGIGLPVLVRESTRATLKLLLSIVLVLLLLAAANLTNLLLVRGAERLPESRVRVALGASRRRVLQQRMVEAQLIAAAGGAAGVALGVALAAVFRGQALLGLPAITDVPLDWRVAALALALATFIGALTSAGAGFMTLRAAAWSGVKASADVSGGRSARLLRSTFAALQIAAAITMLSGAGLIARTYSNLRSVPLGFDMANVFVFAYSPSRLGYDQASRRVLDERLLRAVQTLPGVTAASLGAGIPTAVAVTYGVRDPSRGEEIQAMGLEVTGSYFGTLGTRLLEGRAFSPDDDHRKPQEGRGVVLSAAAARTLFGDAPAVGRTVRVMGPVATEQVVIGVAEDARLRGPRSNPVSAVYLPLGAAFQASRYLLVRSTLSRPQVERMVRASLEAIDSSLAFTRVEPLEEIARRSIAEEKLLARLLTLCAILAVALAAVGVYGIVAYSMAQRKKEIGIRMALGAGVRQIAALALHQALRLVALGIIAGGAGAYLMARLLAGRLFGLEAADPAVHAAAVASLTAVAVAASVAPALRAANADDLVHTLRTH